MRLASDGLVILEDHKGFRVAPVSREELVDITSTRVELEGLAVALAIDKGDDFWEAGVLARFHEMSKRSSHTRVGTARRRVGAAPRCVSSGALQRLWSAMADWLLPDSRGSVVPVPPSAARGRRSHARSPLRARGDHAGGARARQDARRRAASGALQAHGADAARPLQGTRVDKRGLSPLTKWD